MKKINFLLAFMLISLFTFGGTVKNNHANVGTLKLEKSKISNDQINLKLDLGDITNLSKEKTESIINNFLNERLSSVVNAAACEATVTAKASVGIMEITVSVTVKGTCSEVRQRAAAMAKELINSLKSVLSNM